MASPRKLDFSSPSSSKKKNKSALFQRIWSEDDEIALLQGLIDYKVKPNSDWDAFIGFIGGSVVATKFSKEQIMSKVCKLKGKFRERMRKISKGHRVPLFEETLEEYNHVANTCMNNNAHNNDDGVDHVAIAGMNNAQDNDDGEEDTLEEYDNVANQGMNNAHGSDDGEDKDVGQEGNTCMNNAQRSEDGDEPLTENQETQEELKDDEADVEDERCAVKDATDEPLLESEAEETSTHTTTTVKKIYEARETHQEVANTEPLNENEPREHPAFAVESNREEEEDEEAAAAAEEEDADVVEEELCELRDAFETTLAEGVSKCNKKYMLEKINNMETRKRKDLSSEWKAICAEASRLRIKKFRFAAKLAEETL
ncbi:unnamed protein product [Cochlearia groenlandica]